MSKLNIWTVDEYYNKMKEYFSSKEKQGDKVIKIIAPGNLGGGYHYWIKPSLLPFEKQVDIWWNYEPLMRRYFSSKEELEKEMNPEIKNAHGFSLRWLFREDEIVYQIHAIIGNVNDFVNELKRLQDGEYLMGFKMDPFTYVKKLPTKKGYDGEEYIDSKSPDLKVIDNYRVFWEEITPEQFLQEEKLYTDEKTHKDYKDDLVENWEMKKDTIKFFKKHTDFKYD